MRSLKYISLRLCFQAGVGITTHSSVCENDILSLGQHFFKKVFIYLFLERGEEKERGREASMCGCLSHVPHWGPGPQPRHVP